MFRKDDDDWCDVEINAIIRVSEKAVLIELDDGEETWIPKSVIQDGESLEAVGGHNVLLVKEWFARKEGII